MSMQEKMKANPLLRKAAEKPPGNYVVIFGGMGAAEKVRHISAFIDRAKKILIGGSTAYSFLAAQGKDVGNSKVEEDCFEQCRAILKKAAEKNVKIILPIDHIAAIQVEPEVTIKMIKKGENIPDNMMGLDIGFDTIKLFSAELQDAELILWHGPLGVFEIETFAAGTTEIAKAVADSPAEAIIIGEDLVTAIEKTGVSDRVSYKTTESSAALKFLTGKN